MNPKKFIALSMVSIAIGFGLWIIVSYKNNPIVSNQATTTTPIVTATSSVAEAVPEQPVPKQVPPKKEVETPAIPSKPTYQPQYVDGTAMTVANVFAAVNNERIKAGLAPLEENAQLTVAAEAHLADMQANHYYGHVSPSGKQYYSFATDAGYVWKSEGENLSYPEFNEVLRGYDTFRKVQDLVTAWMNSPEHRVNIVNPSFVDTGIAIGFGDNGTVVVQEFGSR